MCAFGSDFVTDVLYRDDNKIAFVCAFLVLIELLMLYRDNNSGSTSGEGRSCMREWMVWERVVAWWLHWRD